jgi:hypothetical protein
MGNMGNGVLVPFSMYPTKQLFWMRRPLLACFKLFVKTADY